MINLCHHQKDFGLQVLSHNFFLTSHGKNVCDGIGAIVKRLTRRASLQRTNSNHILTTEDMFNYLDTNVSSIK